MSSSRVQTSFTGRPGPIAFATCASSAARCIVGCARRPKLPPASMVSSSHALRRQSEHAWRSPVFPGLELAAEARQRALAVPVQEAVERLHRRVRQIGEDVLRLDHAAGACKRRLRIAVRAGDEAGLPRERTIFFDELLAAALFGCRLVPGDAQLLASLAARASAVGIDRDARGNLLHVDHARDARAPRVASKLATLPPKRGGRATTTVSMPGSRMSIVNCAVPFDLSRRCRAS